MRNHLFLVLLFVSTCLAAPQIWIYCKHNLQVDANVQVLKNLIDTGKPSGYNGIVIDDYKLSILSSGLVASNWYTNFKTVYNYAVSQGYQVVVGVWPFGYSDAIFQTTGNYQLAEPLLHANASFVVTSSKTLQAVPCCAALPDGGFETFSGNSFSKWSWQDSRVVPDTTTFHSGHSSARINAGSGNNARVVLSGFVTGQWKMFHVQAYIKTSGYSGGFQIVILDPATGKSRNFNNYNPATTQDWTVVDFVFNSMSSATVNIYCGNWGGSQGTIWIDDVLVQEYPLFNVVQRSGAPFKVYNPSTGKVYTAGTDYNTYNDPATANGYLNNYHVVPAVTLPTGSSLTAGTVVQIDYYGVIPVYNSQIGACLTHPSVSSYMSANVKAVSDAIPAGTGIFLGYDEMRHMHSCQLCKAAAATAGQLLANHVNTSVNLWKNYKNATGVFPNANSKFYFWSDMFDPNHNAVNNYYEVPDTIANSWNSLPANAIMFNWDLGNLANSLNFFANTLHRQQIVAGYYDSGDGYSSGSSERSTASAYSNVLGYMYTTWNNDYSQLTSYARGVNGN